MSDNGSEKWNMGLPGPDPTRPPPFFAMADPVRKKSIVYCYSLFILDTTRCRKSVFTSCEMYVWKDLTPLDSPCYAMLCYARCACTLLPLASIYPLLYH
jgi:hypothetical protein